MHKSSKVHDFFHLSSIVIDLSRYYSSVTPPTSILSHIDVYQFVYWSILKYMTFRTNNLDKNKLICLFYIKTAGVFGKTIGKSSLFYIFGKSGIHSSLVHWWTLPLSSPGLPTLLQKFIAFCSSLVINIKCLLSFFLCKNHFQYKLLNISAMRFGVFLIMLRSESEGA